MFTTSSPGPTLAELPPAGHRGDRNIAFSFVLKFSLIYTAFNRKAKRVHNLIPQRNDLAQAKYTCEDNPHQSFDTVLAVIYRQEACGFESYANSETEDMLRAGALRFQRCISGVLRSTDEHNEENHRILGKCGDFLCVVGKYRQMEWNLWNPSRVRAGGRKITPCLRQLSSTAELSQWTSGSM